MVKITGIENGSLADKLGISEGERLIAINENEVNDILDYRFFETDSILTLKLENNYKKVYEVKVRKPRYSSLGLEFETYLMDEKRSCKNKCVFCFIDQLPNGMRESLYFKDDDDRLSFLFGNYITLTNIGQKEIDRIIKMRISPINISVHTMNPELRCEMMKNKFAGDSIKYIKMLSDSGIKLNCQLVLCPTLNNGKELEFTLNELYKLGENLQSLALVPVGLTKFRDNLYPLRAFTKEEAGAVIDMVEKFGDRLYKERGSRTVYPSDEFYLIAKRELPNCDFYEDFAQIENGVGMMRNLEEEFMYAIEDASENGVLDEFKNGKKRKISSVTGTAVYTFLETVIDKLREKCDNLSINVHSIENKFFGGCVDVTGLLTGIDIYNALKDEELYDELLIPDVMLKADEDVFLDDMTLEELSKKLKINIRKVGPQGEDLLNALLGI